MIANAVEAHRIMRERFAAGWKTGVPPTQVTPVQWPNQPFKPPGSAPWARFEITAGDSFNAVVGTTQIRSVGVIWIGICIPIQTGTETGWALAEIAATIFRNQIIDGVHFKAADIREGSNHDGWRLFTVTIPYFYDLYY